MALCHPINNSINRSMVCKSWFKYQRNSKTFSACRMLLLSGKNCYPDSGFSRN